MCGRFTLTSTPESLAERFGFEASSPDVPKARSEPRYNVAPGQDVLAMRSSPTGLREAVSLRWGLVPAWAPDPSVGGRMINARAESASERRAYREALAARRCVVPADGFYEWEDLGAGKQPHWIGLEGGLPFGIAGLWERWRDDAGGALETCTLLTVDANERVRALHGRMPLLVPREREADWLAESADGTAVLAEIRAGSDPAFVHHPVSTRVNDVRHDDAACAAVARPLPRQESLF